MMFYAIATAVSPRAAARYFMPADMPAALRRHATLDFHA